MFACTKDESVETETSTKKEIIAPSGVISLERAKVLNDEWTKSRAFEMNKSRT